MSEEKLDIGDKISTSIGYKKGLPNYSSIDFHVSVSIAKRQGETDQDVWKRAWDEAERELDDVVVRAQKILDGDEQ